MYLAVGSCELRHRRIEAENSSIACHRNRMRRKEDWSIEVFPRSKVVVVSEAQAPRPLADAERIAYNSLQLTRKRRITIQSIGSIAVGA